MWRGRLKGVQRNVEVWQALLSVRSLVLPRHHDTHTWLKFASLARKSNRIRRASLPLQAAVLHWTQTGSFVTYAWDVGLMMEEEHGKACLRARKKKSLGKRKRRAINRTAACHTSNAYGLLAGSDARTGP